MYKIYYSSIIIISFFTSCNPKEGPNPLIPEIPKGSNIALIGSNVCARMLHYDYFTAHLQSQLNTSNLRVLNFCDDGDTPGFRPHSGRNLPWAYPGAEKFFTEYANNSESQGTFPYPDEWLTKYKADIILVFLEHQIPMKVLIPYHDLRLNCQHL